MNLTIYVDILGVSTSNLESDQEEEFQLSRKPFIFQVGNYSRIKKLTGLKGISEEKIKNLIERIEEL